MLIRVRYVGLTRNKTGKKLEELEMIPGSTLRDLMAMLAETYGEALKDPEQYIVVHNQKGYNQKDWQSGLLRENDDVLLISNIAGG